MTRTLRRSAPWIRLAAEKLESREGPSSLTDPLAFLLSPPLWEDVLVANVGANQSPRIVDFRAIIGANGVVTFTGSVIDDQPVAGTLVRIQGTGIDLAAIVGSDGKFSVATTVFSLDDITVSATVTDVNGLVSETAYTIFTPSVTGGMQGATALEIAPANAAGNPVIAKVTGTSGSADMVTIAGTAVDDKNLGGCLVKLSGDGVSEMGLVESTGRFSVSFTRPTSGDFVVTVTVVDSDGNISQPVSVLVSGT